MSDAPEKPAAGVDHIFWGMAVGVALLLWSLSIFAHLAAHLPADAIVCFLMVGWMNALWNAKQAEWSQVGRPVHTDGLIAFLPRLKEAGFTQGEIDIMTKRNPARLLGLR